MVTQAGGYIPLSQPIDGQMRGAYNQYGRDVPFNPELQRARGLSGGFGGGYEAALGMQGNMYNQFGQLAAGQGPSLAQAQLQEGMATASQAATQQMLGARGGNAAGAQAAAGAIGSSMGGQAAMASAALRQQEQLAAMQAQAAMANQMAGQGLQGQLGMEQLYQGALGGQLEANLASRQIADARSMQGYDKAESIKGMIMPDLSDERAKTNVRPTMDFGMPMNARPPKEEEGGMDAGGILGLLGGDAAAIAPFLALSDERAKTEVRPGNLSASGVVGQLDPSSWEYRAGFGPQGQEQLGVTAQNMERAYPQAVVDIGGLKHLDVARVSGLNIAATAEQEQRLRRMEAMLAGVQSPLQMQAQTPLPSEAMYGRPA